MAKLMKTKYTVDSYVSELDELFLERLEILMDISLDAEDLYKLLEDVYGISVRVVIKKLPRIREHFLLYSDVLEQSEELKDNTSIIHDRLQEYSSLIKKYNIQICKLPYIFAAKTIGFEPEQELDMLLGEPF